MKLTDFNYEYPKELVAQHPLANRDDSRMMAVDRRARTCIHSKISDFPKFLKAGDLVIINDTKVIPARLFGKRRNGEEIELLVVEPAEGMKGTWRCLLKRARHIRKGEQFFFGMHATAKAKGRDDVYLLVEFKGDALELARKYHGVPPLPPYIERDGFEAYTEEDSERYQTIFAERTGSAAAPTAGLHFTEKLLDEIKKAGAGIERVTLHVGLDTFAPVRADDIRDHRMHGEHVEISKKCAQAVKETRGASGRIIAIGTTTTRALESAAMRSGRGSEIDHGNWITDIFIVPGFEFKIVDVLLTNFHQPGSTLLMMVSAFAGCEFILSCYEKAIEGRYRLFSYGDCMLIT